MNYHEFEDRIRRLVASASEKARYQFAQDTIKLLRRSGAETLSELLPQDSQELVNDIITKLDVESTVDLKKKLKRLISVRVAEHVDGDPSEFDKIEPLDGHEIHPDITELLCAVDNWLEYRATRNPYFIERIAINMVNSLDYYIGGDSGEYSTDNFLGEPAMREEFHRQEHFLGGHE